MSFHGFKRIIFWQYLPSPHQIPALENLAELVAGADVLLICDQQINQSLLDLGWQSVKQSNLQTIIEPSSNVVRRFADESPTSTLHVLNGLYYVEMVQTVYKRLLNNGASFGLLSEGREYLGIKGCLRVVQSLLFDRKIAQNCDFVLAMGTVGETWYLKVGYSETKVFKYIYTPALGPDTELSLCLPEEFVVLFVGRLEDRKRVDLLLRAIANLNDKDLVVHIVGGGEEEYGLKALARKLGIERQVKWLGVVPNQQLQNYYQTADLLVLPSRWDGWGAVVNEALLAGTPVTVSDSCGASVLLGRENDLLGCSFASGSVDGLTTCILARLASGKLTKQQRSTISHWAQESISGQAAAIYLHDVLSFIYESKTPAGRSRPLPPWLNHEIEVKA